MWPETIKTTNKGTEQIDRNEKHTIHDDICMYIYAEAS